MKKATAALFALSLRRAKLGVILVAIGAVMGGSLGSLLPYRSAHAYTQSGCHVPDVWTTQIIAWYDWGTNLQTPGTAWRIAWETAMSDWNSANTTKTVNIYGFPSEPNTINSIWDEENGSWYGAFAFDDNPCVSSSPHHYTDWFLLNNVYTTLYFSATERRSVANHELGHLLGLWENNSPGYNAIMDQNRDRSSIYVAQTDDINGVNSIHNHSH
ncbi:MAG: matrixin family metalloprotease [Chloroflexi bacterium]|nr:matrixin family metalloprotease [Chloroflexota bacterium]